MKSKVIFLALKKRLNSKACKKFTASAKALSIFKNKSQYPLQ